MFCGLFWNALLFYNKLAGKLVEMGFEINPYDLYITKKTINGKMAVTWCVDDLKVSYEDPIEVIILIYRQ